MKIIGQHKHTFEIGYEIKMPEILYASNKPNMTLEFSYNLNQLKVFKKGVFLTAKYLKKMQRLGFEIDTESEMVSLKQFAERLKNEIKNDYEDTDGIKQSFVLDYINRVLKEFTEANNGKV